MVEAPDRAPGRLFVLLVDDDPDNREPYAIWLRNAGHEVAEAPDGAAAMALLATAKPDVIVMDLGMPGLDGWTTTRAIKSAPETKDIVIIVHTGFDDPEDVARAHAAGADIVCTKPICPDVLLVMIHARVGRRA